MSRVETRSRLELLWLVLEEGIRDDLLMTTKLVIGPACTQNWDNNVSIHEFRSCSNLENIYGEEVKGAKIMMEDE